MKQTNTSSERERDTVTKRESERQREGSERVEGSLLYLMLIERKRMQVGDKSGKEERCQTYRGTEGGGGGGGRGRVERLGGREVGGNCRMESDVAAVCGNNRVYFSRSDVSKGSHGRRENETKV